MHRLALVHQLAVAPGDGGQRVVPVEAGVQRAVEGGGLPGRAVHPAPAALLDDAEVAVAVGGLDSPGVQPGRGERQQLVADQASPRRPRPCRRTGRGGASAARRRCRPAGGVEVGGGRLERQPGPHRPGLLGQRADQAVVEGRVGDDVDDGGSGRQDPVLHPQVRHAVGDPVDRAVPAVDRAVVQDELGERGTPPSSRTRSGSSSSQIGSRAG